MVVPCNGVLNPFSASSLDFEFATYQEVLQHFLEEKQLEAEAEWQRTIYVEALEDEKTVVCQGSLSGSLSREERKQLL